MLSLENKPTSHFFLMVILASGIFSQCCHLPTSVSWSRGVGCPCSPCGIPDRALLVLHPPLGGVQMHPCCHNPKAHGSLRHPCASELPPGSTASCDGPIIPPCPVWHFRSGLDLTPFQAPGPFPLAMTLPPNTQLGFWVPWPPAP